MAMTASPSYGLLIIILVVRCAFQNSQLNIITLINEQTLLAHFGSQYHDDMSPHILLDSAAQKKYIKETDVRRHRMAIEHD